MHYHATMLTMKFDVTVMLHILPTNDRILHTLVIRALILLPVHNTIRVAVEVVVLAAAAAVAAIATEVEVGNQQSDQQQIVSKVTIFI